MQLARKLNKVLKRVVLRPALPEQVHNNATLRALENRPSNLALHPFPGSISLPPASPMTTTSPPFQRDWRSPLPQQKASVDASANPSDSGTVRHENSAAAPVDASVNPSDTGTVRHENSERSHGDDLVHSLNDLNLDASFSPISDLDPNEDLSSLVDAVSLVEQNENPNASSPNQQRRGKSLETLRQSLVNQNEIDDDEEEVQQMPERRTTRSTAAAVATVNDDDQDSKESTSDEEQSEEEWSEIEEEDSVIGVSDTVEIMDGNSSYDGQRGEVGEITRGGHYYVNIRGDIVHVHGKSKLKKC